jgi:murein L,D-transpeptidase YcbB/YkuD
VRVQNIRDYVAWILKDTAGWDRDRIDEAIRSGARIDARPAAPVPVHWVYVTAWANDGIVQFREDIYQRDGFGSTVAALQPALQPAEAPNRDPRAGAVQKSGLLAPMNDD